MGKKKVKSKFSEKELNLKDQNANKKVRFNPLS